MTENNKQEHTPEGTVKAKVSTETNTKKALPTQPNGKTASIPAVSLVLSIAALAASGWLYYQSTQSPFSHDIKQLSIQQANLSSQLESQGLKQSALNQLAGQVNKAEQTIQQQQSQLTIQQQQQNQQYDNLLSLESKLNRLNNTTKEDWKLAEAEYLIRLANQRLLLESDSSGVEALLTSADNILNELEDPIFFDTRKALAKDIQALKSTSQFDLVGYYLQLSALYDNVETLPQREPSKEWQKTAEPTAPLDSANMTSNKITSTLSNLWQSIRSLVVINYHHKPIKALLPPAEYQELVTGLQLQIDVAEIALVKGETVIYQKALSRVADAVTEHFDTQAKSVISFLASLTALQQVNPAPELPLPRNSLVTMKALMKEWNSRAEKGRSNDAESMAKHSTPIEAEIDTELPQVDATQENTPQASTPSPEEAVPEDITDKETAPAPEKNKVTTPDEITGDKA